MRKLRTNKGFTLVEALFVVAIIVVLGGVIILSVVDHLRSMAKTENDGYAKTIFVAAQNHLTMAQHEGYLGRKNFGHVDDDAPGVFYYVVDQGSGFNDDDSVLDLMLPFGSVDDSVRSGSYIVRYQKSSGKVLDVFYWQTDGRYAYSYVDGDCKLLLAAVNEDEDSLRNYGPDGSVIGYYGGAGLEMEPGAEMTAPQIQVVNAERLYVLVSKTINSPNEYIDLVIHGETSDAYKRLKLIYEGDSHETTIDGETKYQVILDDICDQSDKNYHFSKINTDMTSWKGSGKLIPGENISIQAIAYNNAVYTNVAYSSEQKTNSLFADLVDSDDEDELPDTVMISNIRHLENLDRRISELTSDDESQAKIPIHAAVQTTDLSWKNFADALETPALVRDAEGHSSSVDANSGYEPISPNYELSYDGQYHTISGVVIEVEADGTHPDAGLFGNPTGKIVVKNLRLQDFSVSGKKAGTLAATLPAGSEVRNVLVCQSKTATSDARVIAKGDCAGGLVAEAKGSYFEACAASVYVVSETHDAGGLIGKTSEGMIKACYSGGHTVGGAYVTTLPGENPGDAPVNGFNVIAAGTAGGLVGSCDSSIEFSYSTCSVDGGSLVGGLVGSCTRSIKDCYSTGLVHCALGGTVGAFAGSLDGNVERSGNRYFSIINGGSGTVAVGALSHDASAGASVVYAFDMTTYDYQSFVSAGDSTPAAPYDDTLVAYYQGNFNLRTVNQLGYTRPSVGVDEEEPAPDFVETHCGDWPAPEVLFVNTPVGSGS